MQRAAGTDLFNPLVPKAHNSEWQNILFPLQIEPVKSKKGNWRIFIFCTLDTNGLMVNLCLCVTDCVHVVVYVVVCVCVCLSLRVGACVCVCVCVWRVCVCVCDLCVYVCTVPHEGDNFTNSKMDNF